MMTVHNGNTLTFRWLTGILFVLLSSVVGLGLRTHLQQGETNAVALQQMYLNLARLAEEIHTLRADFEVVKSQGSPITDWRLRRIEFKLGIPPGAPVGGR